MNAENLRDRYPELIAYMESQGYSKAYVGDVRREIEHIIANAYEKDWKSYTDVYRDYAGLPYSQQALSYKRSLLGLIGSFDESGEYPNGRHKQSETKRGKYHLLEDDFKAVVDYYNMAAKRQGKKDSTIYNGSHSIAKFLYELQEKGFGALDAITEKAIWSAFVGADGHPNKSGTYKQYISAAFKVCVPHNPEAIGKILSYIPALRRARKNIQYLQPEEIAAVKQELAEADSPLTLRDKAITLLILNTGMRSSDVAGLTVSSIDWENDIILIEQQKTEAPLELPLSASVGNAIYDYLALERPDTECGYVFVSKRAPFRRMTSNGVGTVAKKLFSAAGIRQSEGDRRGYHIFRHRLATALLGNGVARPVISQILGHESPSSLEAYLSADIVNLKECALSIESFPIDEGVFANA